MSEPPLTAEELKEMRRRHDLMVQQFSKVVGGRWPPLSRSARIPKLEKKMPPAAEPWAKVHARLRNEFNRTTPRFVIRETRAVEVDTVPRIATRAEEFMAIQALVIGAAYALDGIPEDRLEDWLQTARQIRAQLLQQLF